MRIRAPVGSDPGDCQSTGARWRARSRMLDHDPIALWVATSAAGGFAAHLVIAAWYRRTYRRLRDAYVGAVADAQETGEAHALVRAQELHRQFMRASPPSWLSGVGVHIRA